MAFDTKTKQVLVSGANVVLRVKALETDAAIVLGLISNTSFNENFQIQKANCIGRLGPVSMEPKDYSCEITIGAFVPKVATNLPEGSTKSGDNIIPLRSTALADAVAAFATKGTKFAYLDFYDNTAGSVLHAFTGVIVSSAGKQIEGGSFIRQNIQLQALDRVAAA